MGLNKSQYNRIKFYINQSKELFIFILFTCLSILIRGYQYGSGNQVHYFNFAFYKFYPELYQHDYLFKIHDLRYTFFVDAIYRILTLVGESTFAFFCVYFLFLLLFYVAIYKITHHFFKNSPLSWLLLFFFIVPIPIGGSTISTLDKSLMPRFVAEICLLFSLYFVLVKNYTTSAVVAGLGFLIHPLTIIPYLPIVLLNEIILNISLFSLQHARKFVAVLMKQLLLTVLVFFLVSSPILVTFLHGQHGSFILDDQWRSIIYDRLPYLFVYRWSLINFIVLLAICVYFGAYRYIFKKKLDPTVLAIWIVSMGFFVAGYVSSVFSIRMGLQLQLSRNLYALVIMAIAYGLGSIMNRFSVFHLKCIAVVMTMVSIVLSFPARLEYGALWINPLEQYQEVALWAKNNTPQDSVFVVPLDEFGFRFWSKRAVFLEHKEGGDSLYDRDFAMEWNKREELIENNKDFNEEYLLQLKNEYRVDYIVTRQELNGLQAVYRKNKYRIYKI